VTSTPIPVAGLTTRPATGTKPLPPHGTEARYRGSRKSGRPGCPCTPCVNAHSRACKRREVERLAGRSPLHPGAPLVKHIERLQESGMSNELIARRAGVAASTIKALVHGITQSCRRSKALRILAVQPGDFDERAERPSIGSRRRLQALYAMRHGVQDLAAATGLAASAVSSIANGHTQQIDALSAAAISRAYQQLSSVRGTSDKAERRATALGWPDPVWWEDYGHIDDPDFDPTSVDQGLSRNELGAVRREEIAHLGSFNLSIEEIASRLDLSVKHVREVLRELRAGERRNRGAVA